ncbi:MAG TPA: type II toxin-antitoxin system HicB family antitoxin [Terriglobia bacterium]|nr:type II toxin-antitoxin system HicB family antitoxin [Terriglobia bacterium]
MLGATRRWYNPAMKVLNYTVVMTPDETGGYVVTCPSLPGLVTEGDTLEEARAMAADAILCYLEGLDKAGLPAPPNKPAVTEPVSVQVA